MQSTTTKQIPIRWMIRRDFEQVCNLEVDYDDRWTPENYLAALRRRDTLGMVTEDANYDVTAAMIYTIGRDKLIIGRLIVGQKYRRSGYGRRLVEKLIGRLEGKRSTLFTNVDERNLPGQLFLSACGLTAGDIWTAEGRTFYEFSCGETL